jgi:hypothetical protein
MLVTVIQSGERTCACLHERAAINVTMLLHLLYISVTLSLLTPSPHTRHAAQSQQPVALTSSSKPELQHTSASAALPSAREGADEVEEEVSGVENEATDGRLGGKEALSIGPAEGGSREGEEERAEDREVVAHEGLEGVPERGGEPGCGQGRLDDDAVAVVGSRQHETGSEGKGRWDDLTGSVSPLSMYNALSLARGISGVAEGAGERE